MWELGDILGRSSNSNLRKTMQRRYERDHQMTVVSQRCAI